MKGDALYLRHILEMIRRAEENTATGRDAFMSSHALQDAVLRNLQTMAESTQHLSDAAKQSTPSIDWRAISGLRNVLVHNYLGVDLDQVWLVVHRDLPPLKAAATALLAAADLGT